MKPIWITGMPLMLAMTLTACGSFGGQATSTASPGSAPATQAATAPATPASSAAASPAGTSGASLGTIDPCKLVTPSEASALTGVSYGPGREESEPGTGGERRCIYGYQTLNVFEVAVARASSVAQAQSVKNTMLAQAQQALGGTPLTLTSVSGLADSAEALRGNESAGGATIALSGLYVLRGTIGFALVDAAAGTSAPSKTALVGQAKTVLGRLP